MGTRYIFRYYNAWVFRYQRLSKSFRDKDFGSKSKALKAALKWRNHHFDKLGLPPVNDGPRYSKTKSKPLNPIVGISRSCSFVKGHGYIVYWRASWYQGKLCAKNFSIGGCDEETAFLLACDARYDACGVLIVKNFDQMPCKPHVPYEDYYAL